MTDDLKAQIKVLETKIDGAIALLEQSISQMGDRVEFGDKQGMQAISILAERSATMERHQEDQGRRLQEIDKLLEKHTHLLDAMTKTSVELADRTTGIKNDMREAISRIEETLSDLRDSHTSDNAVLRRVLDLAEKNSKELSSQSNRIRKLEDKWLWMVAMGAAGVVSGYLGAALGIGPVP